MAQEDVLNWVVLIIVGGSLAIGLLSMLIGKLSDLWDAHRSAMASASGGSLVRNDSRTGADAGLTGLPDLGLPHQNQIEPSEPAKNEPAREPTTLRNMTRVEEIAVLAVQRNDDGSYRHSANKITELMGGTAADVKAQVAAIRGPTKPASAPLAARTERPANGWK